MHGRQLRESLNAGHSTSTRIPKVTSELDDVNTTAAVEGHRMENGNPSTAHQHQAQKLMQENSSQTALQHRRHSIDDNDGRYYDSADSVDDHSTDLHIGVGSSDSRGAGANDGKDRVKLKATVRVKVKVNVKIR